MVSREQEDGWEEVGVKTKGLDGYSWTKMYSEEKEANEVGFEPSESYYITE